MSRQPLRIQIGNRWTFFTYARTDCRLLGTVQDGMQIGALAQLDDGSYAQVNGDVIRPLNTSRVMQVLSRTPGAPASAAPAAARPATPATVPTVIIKKRRIVRPSTENTGA
ncbi:hypothetical protein SRS16CHR_03889 [Variovorax sp. SRS16]|uniref:hypothetical protein n=1 Tax=Variovorax sp. SRS16 TaxID=282217 RepID=UPI0013176B53|nr:hypothetical protein [Variovorax sp. SRS16]VTU26596.1 hypothetical protein SRS16CHR_03889 [Variovorax sp. SRS16]